MVSLHSFDVESVVRVITQLWLTINGQDLFSENQRGEMMELRRQINVEPAVFLFLFGVYLMDLPGRLVLNTFLSTWCALTL